MLATHSLRRLGAPALALALSLSPLALAQEAVWTVDDDAPADYTDIQSAVNAAASGDVVLVRPGDYSSFTVDGKSLTLQVDGAPGSATVYGVIFGLTQPAIHVKNLAADQSVLLRGLHTWTWSLVDHDDSFVADQCAGAVIVEDCTIYNRFGHAAVVEDSASVTFVRSKLDPGGSFFDEFESVFLKRNGLHADGSTVYVYDSEVLGSLGPDAAQTFWYFPPGNGGDAAYLRDSTLYAYGSTFIGGDGGSALDAVCDDGYDGGDGIEGLGSSSVHYQDTTVQAGVGGAASCGLIDGAAGAPFVLPPAALTPLPGLARSFDIASPVADGTQLDMTFAGEPGDSVLILVGLDPTPGIYFDPLGIAQHLAPPFALLEAGIVGGDGALALSIPLPSLGPNNEYERYPAQAVFFGVAGGVYASGPSTLLLKGVGY